ncbi:MAG: DUF1778 domain-containing protein [Candidatus Firestonebacteria bacterium]|nr:DUF1778 domain-containing protein [Candidatus Firestonebacteria bacterium]
MSRVLTLRVSEEEYKKIFSAAKIENRPVSNFITTIILKEIEETLYISPIEMAQIKSDKKLLEKLKKGHADAGRRNGKLIG